MLKIRDIITDPAALLGQMLLVSVDEVYQYENDKRTDLVQGYRYVVLLTQLGYEKLGVKIDIPKQLLIIPEGELIEVNFTNLELFTYKDELRARATGISKSQNKQ